MKTIIILTLTILLFSCQKDDIEPEIGFVIERVESNCDFPGYYWMYINPVPFQYWDLVQSGTGSNIYIGVVVAIYPDYFVTQWYDGEGIPHNGSRFIHIGSVGNIERVNP